MAVKITAAGWNDSSEVFILSFGTQLDHPLGPVFCFTDDDIHTYSKARTLSPARPMRWPFCYLLLASFVCVDHLETPFCCCRKGGGESTKLPKMHILTRRTTKKGFWTIKWTTGANAEFLKINNCPFQNSEQLKMCAGRQWRGTGSDSLWGLNVSTFVWNKRKKPSQLWTHSHFYKRNNCVRPHTGCPGDIQAFLTVLSSCQHSKCAHFCHLMAAESKHGQFRRLSTWSYLTGREFTRRDCLPVCPRFIV